MFRNGVGFWKDYGLIQSVGMEWSFYLCDFYNIFSDDCHRFFRRPLVSETAPGRTAWPNPSFITPKLLFFLYSRKTLPIFFRFIYNPVCARSAQPPTSPLFCTGSPLWTSAESSGSVPKLAASGQFPERFRRNRSFHTVTGGYRFGSAYRPYLAPTPGYSDKGFLRNRWWIWLTEIISNKLELSETTSCHFALWCLDLRAAIFRRKKQPSKRILTKKSLN